MRGLQFGRPKGPGYAISSDFYITVLSARPTLPPLLQVINPHGEGGAVEGFGVPLGGETAPGRLAQPITRGAYALATRDRKTVLKMLVLSKEEASFNPEPYALSHAAEEAPA
ncbi:MAG: hypothetical protein HY248_06210 [Fimbriimonas ginsengisoli]|nr:hypothetical protein [Fimbriimonas ginsengisoli]